MANPRFARNDRSGKHPCFQFRPAYWPDTCQLHRLMKAKVTPPSDLESLLKDGVPDGGRGYAHHQETRCPLFSTFWNAGTRGSHARDDAS